MTGRAREVRRRLSLRPIPTLRGGAVSRWRDRLLDLALWAVLGAPVAVALLTPPHPPWYLARLAGSLLLIAVAVLVSRRVPLLALVLVVVPTVQDGNFLFAIPALSYLAGLRERRVGPAALVFASIAFSGTIFNLGLLDTDLEVWFTLAGTLLVSGVFPWLVGRYHRQHRALVLAGWEQAELLEREQHAATERIRMRERARIAQDMHDSLGHDLSLIALRAGALEVAPDLAERHRQAIGELRANVALATDRLRQVIGVLRDDAERAPIRPAGESVDDLVERARAAGMAVQLLIAGDSAVAGTGSPTVEQAVSAVVREALTNATRHAPGAAVTVAVTRTAERISVRVTNDRPPAGPLPGVRTAGSGLVGLRERVRLAGGTLRADPSGGGGFEVRAELPTAGRAEPTAMPSDPAMPVDAVEPLGAVEAFTVGTAYRLRFARRRVRRSLLAALVVPAVIGALLLLVYYPIATFDAVLDSDRFDQLRVGQDQDEVRDLLPHRQVAPPESGAGEPVPGDASCEFYSDGGFPPGRVVYQICFRQGRLVGKDRLAD